MKYKIWSLDTEDDSQGHTSIIDFYNGKTHHTFFNQKEAIEFLFKNVEYAQIWTTNLGYDLANLFYSYPENVSITYAGSRVITAKLTNAPVYFKDTLNHWKISVKEMGERINHKKLEENLFDGKKQPTKQELIRRCHRDSEITYMFTKKMAEKYESIGAKLKSTIGSSSLDLYYTKTGRKRPQSNEFSPQELEFMREGLYGGRTEAFFNKPIKGKIWVYDYNSLYPSVMHDFPFPHLNERHFTKTPNLEKEGILYARFLCPNLTIPYLPCRRDNTLYFPVGEFDSHVTYFEAREAIKKGYKIIKVHEALEFTGGTFQPFKALIKELYDGRLIAQKEKDVLLSDTFKLIMNNLFGKYGQSNEKVELVPITKERLKKHQATILDSKWMLIKEKGDYPAHTNYIWSAYVTAYGRHRLYEGIEKAEKAGGKFLYCDTDSLFIRSDREIFTNETGLGKLKLEGTLKFAYFMGLKNYKLITEDDKKIYKSKGVPRAYAEDFFEKKSATYRKPTRLRETLRHNTGKNKTYDKKPNVWLEVTKENKKKYDKRKVLKNGETEPHKFKIETRAN